MTDDDRPKPDAGPGDASTGDGVRVPEPSQHRTESVSRVALWTAFAGGTAAWVPGTFLGGFPAYYEQFWPWTASALTWIAVGVVLQKTRGRAPLATKLSLALLLSVVCILGQVLSAVAMTTGKGQTPWDDIVWYAGLSVALGVFLILSAAAAFRDVGVRR